MSWIQETVAAIESVSQHKVVTAAKYASKAVAVTPVTASDIMTREMVFMTDNVGGVVPLLPVQQSLLFLDVGPSVQDEISKMLRIFQPGSQTPSIHIWPQTIPAQLAH